MTGSSDSNKGGIQLGLTAYLLWGVLPLYFKLLEHVPATEIVAHRIIWSVILLGLLATLWRRWSAIRAALTNSKVMMTLFATSCLIAVNWLVYIYAITSGHLLEGSLGYYLNPLVNVLFGVVLLKERLTRAQTFACLLAGAGVAVMAVGAGSGIWMSLTLALSFASYGFLRKVAPVDALEGLWVETLILAPAALFWVFHVRAQGTAAFGHQGWLTDALLILGGGVTALPLILFTAAAKRLPYSTLGFLQYIAPSLQFLLAVLVFGEPFGTAKAVCFGAIWTALLIFSVEGLRLARARVATA
ncbi:EamA family transporter RarD [Allosphingosinicella sp.]|uniref:EamA family transporter RarD n=1 Tax=Allosphingosinicella sp. TaxID=2823234 RepID=UPI0037852C88